MNDQHCDHGEQLSTRDVRDHVIEAYAACCLRCRLDVLHIVRFERRVG